MKNIIALAAAVLVTALTSPASADAQSDAMTAAVAELSSVMRKPEGSWTPDDLATFHAARAKMNDSLTSDLNSPLVAEWFSPSPRLGGWLTYGPAEIYLIAKGEPLAMDQAHLFRDFVNHAVDLELDIYNENSKATCISVKALRLLENGPASPEEEQFLNAVLVGAGSMRLNLPQNSFRTAVSIDPAFAGIVGENPDLVKEQDIISGIMGTMLFNAAVSEVALYSDEVLNDLWMDPYTAEEYPQDWVNRAAQQLGESEFPQQLSTARPVFAEIAAQRDNGPDAVLTAICD